MRPNPFIHKNLVAEDHFTISLAYMLNLFPRELGDRLIERISEAADLGRKALGSFEQAEFIGHVFQSQDSTSKPDMVLKTSKTVLFFENKLDAPLSKSQLERHMADVIRAKGRLVFVSNVQSRISPNILRRSAYLKPKGADHFVWADLANVFEIQTRKGSFANQLLEDFRAGLRANGMRSREIAGATGSLYTAGSQALERVLTQYQGILREMSWVAWRKPTEHTLRVYPHRNGIPPLLNPRFHPTGEWLHPELKQECEVINCWADTAFPKARKAIRELKKLERSFHDVRYIEPKHGDGWFMGFLYIPLRFLARGRDYDLDWDRERRVWSAIREILKR